QHGPGIDLIGCSEARRWEPLTGFDSSGAPSYAGIDRASYYSEGRSWKFRHRVPGIGSLSQLSDRKRGVGIEAADQAVVALAKAEFYFQSKSVRQRQLGINPPGVLNKPA